MSEERSAVDEETGANLQGRMVGLELLLRSLLEAHARTFPDPVAAAEDMKSQALASMQLMTRSIDPYTDVVWGMAGFQIRHTMDQVILRMREQYTRR